VEVVGDDQSYSELSRKALEYLAAGAQAVWVLDAEPQRVVVFEAPDRVRVLTAEETLEGGAALPGFACKVAEFFD
jgi:Uma2 family endonuclease